MATFSHSTQNVDYGNSFKHQNIEKCLFSITFLLDNFNHSIEISRSYQFGFFFLPSTAYLN